MDLHKFKVGDTVTVCNRGVVGKVIDIVKPFGTYEMFSPVVPRRIDSQRCASRASQGAT